MRIRQWRALVIALAVVALGGSGIAYAQCGPMDVVFAIDTTGSMGGALDNVKADLPNIINQVQTASGGDFRLGLLEIGGPNDGVVVDIDMAAGNVDAVKKAINAFAAGGGAGIPEASDEAINTILNHFKASDRPTGTAGCGGGPCQTGDFNATFRPEATKVIIMITDAPPSGFDDNFDATDEANVVKYATQAASMGVRIGAIYVPTTLSDVVVRIMQEWATLSHGIYLKANSDGTGTAAAINDIISSCGGASGAGNSLVLTPTEIPLSNGETGDIKVQNYDPGDAKTLVYSATGLPDDSTITFTHVSKPEVDGTDQETMHITIGPDTPAGTYIVNVTASHTGSGVIHQNYVIVFVDCTPPIILGTPGHQPADTTADSNGRANLTVVPIGTLGQHYQWYQGHSGSTAFPIAGATSSTLTTPVVTAPTDFWVRVTNACGSRDSATAVVRP